MRVSLPSEGSETWHEDTDFYFRLLRTGARVVHIPRGVVLHRARAPAWGVSLWQQRDLQFDALLFKKHPRLYRTRIRARPRFAYYACVLGLILTLGGAMVGQPYVALAAGVPWMLFTVWFCGKRLIRSSTAPAHVIETMVTSALIPPFAVFWRLFGAVKYRTLFL